MTKKQMITAIQLQEAQAWLKLKELEAEYGSRDALTKSARSRFSAVYRLMRSLSIDSDYYLPEQIRARELAIRVQ